MKREAEKCILVSSPKVTELLIKLIKEGCESFPKVNVLNISEYSTKFKDILDSGGLTE